MDGDVEIVGDLAEPRADVAGVAEPQLSAVSQPGCRRLGDEQTGVPEPGGDLRGFVQQRSRVDHLQHSWVGLA